MKSSYARVSASRTWILALASGITFYLICTTGSAAKERHQPAKIDDHPVVIMDAVAEQQWTHTLALVNAPENITRLNPGLCLRVAVVATGDGRDQLLEETKIAYRVSFAGADQDHALAPLAATRQIKPEGGDEVTQALGAAGIKNPMLTMASMGVAAERWCVPDNAQDGKAVIESRVQTPSGEQRLKKVEVQVESFETGSKRAFKIEELGDFAMSYYRHPNPARLFPALQCFAENDKLRSGKGNLESNAAFLEAALKADPIAEKDFLTRVSATSGFTRAYGLLVLLSAGFDIDPALKSMTDEERQEFAKHPVLPDPYDFNAGADIPTRFDMLWGIFGATGTFEPVRKIASALEWRPDYEEFLRRRSDIHSVADLTPQLWRGVSYGAAGWSLGSFQRNDGLAADYIEYMLASSDTPAAVKTELSGLSSNPAFRRQ